MKSIAQHCDICDDITPQKIFNTNTKCTYCNNKYTLPEFIPVTGKNLKLALF